MTIPLFICGLLIGSAFSTWFGCTACALSADTIKLDAIARLASSGVLPQDNAILSNVSSKKVESAPCFVPEPTSSLSKIATTGTLSLSFAPKKP